LLSLFFCLCFCVATVKNKKVLIGFCLTTKISFSSKDKNPLKVNECRRRCCFCRNFKNDSHSYFLSHCPKTLFFIKQKTHSALFLIAVFSCQKVIYTLKILFFSLPFPFLSKFQFYCPSKIFFSLS
jgi:hypothetical protein